MEKKKFQTFEQQITLSHSLLILVQTSFNDNNNNAIEYMELMRECSSFSIVNIETSDAQVLFLTIMHGNSKNERRNRN